MSTFNIFVKKSGQTLAVDFNAYPEHVKQHLIEYGLKQKFNDVHSAEENGETAWGMVTNLQERLLAGELSKARSARNPVDVELDNILLTVARARTGEKTAALRALTRVELIALLAKALQKPAERIEEHFKKQAEVIVVEKAKQQKALLEGLDIE